MRHAASTECPLWVKSRHRGISNQCLLYPQKRTLGLSREMSALCQKRTHAPRQIGGLFDHLIGAAKQRKRYAQTEVLGSFQVDNKLDLGGLLNWKIGRFFPL